MSCKSFSAHTENFLMILYRIFKVSRFFLYVDFYHSHNKLKIYFSSKVKRFYVLMAMASFNLSLLSI